jgi:hypothetical protein
VTYLFFFKNARRPLALFRYSHMTPVQAKTLPVIIQGIDVLAKAKTGTGKTLAFLIPSIEVLLHTPPPPQPGAVRVLCLSPTRELASQITKEAEILTRFQPMKTAVMYGGVPIKKDYEKIKVLPLHALFTHKQLESKGVSPPRATSNHNHRCTPFKVSFKVLPTHARSLVSEDTRNHKVFFPLNAELEFCSSDERCDP